MRSRLSLVILISCATFLGCKQKQEEVNPKGSFPIIYNGHLYVKGDADSTKGNFVFDTGAANLYYDSTYYAGNGFKYENLLKAFLPGVGGKPQTVVVVNDSVEFKFGGISYSTSRVPVLQLKPILGDIADGILGMECFYGSILEINYEKEYMKVHSTLDSIKLEGWSRIELTKRDNRLYIPLEVIVNNSVSVSGEFLVDFGSGGSVTLTSVVSEENKLIDNIKNKVAFFRKYGGVGGESTSYEFFAAQLKIGGYNFHNVLMEFSVDKAGALASGKHLGLLGNEIYERFDVLIDFINNHMYIKPNSKFNDLFESSRLGFSYVDRSQTLKSWVVTGLYSSSTAEESGLLVDDKIIKVNGVTVGELNYQRQDSFFRSIDRVTLEVLRNGKLIEINFDLRPVLTVANS